MIKFVKPTEELVKGIADKMRHADAAEVLASHGHTPLEALMNGWNLSDYSVIVVDDDTPLVMFGISFSNLMTGCAIPWMLSSSDLMKHKKRLLQESPKVVEEMLILYPRLVNHVHVKNRISIRWLKWIGFTIEKPEPYGVKQELFHRFHLER